MRFNTPCFVRVENPQERKELIEWLKSIGYEYAYEGSINDNIINCYGDAFNLDYKYHMGCYNCDENINLFKALSAMNYCNDLYQWFTAPGTDRMFLCEGDNIHTNGTDGFEMFWRKATAEEIINHFKN